MSAIKRIKGYCCEVTPDQWRELVKVADEVGVDVGGPRSDRPIPNSFLIMYHTYYSLISISDKVEGQLIPFPDFLAKLRGGAEPWTPKAGEMVEVMRDENVWVLAVFVGVHDSIYVCYVQGWGDVDEDSYFGFEKNAIRPARPRMTRAEAEAKLNCRITD